LASSIPKPKCIFKTGLAAYYEDQDIVHDCYNEDECLDDNDEILGDFDQDEFESLCEQVFNFF
jgi:hypothetical protein